MGFKTKLKELKVDFMFKKIKEKKIKELEEMDAEDYPSWVLAEAALTLSYFYHHHGEEIFNELVNELIAGAKDIGKDGDN